MGVGRRRCIPECSRMSLGEASALPPIQWHFHFGLALADSRALSGACVWTSCFVQMDQITLILFNSSKIKLSCSCELWATGCTISHVKELYKKKTTRNNDKTPQHHPPLLSPMPMPTPASMVRAGSLRTLVYTYIYIWLYMHNYILIYIIYIQITLSLSIHA